MKILLINLSPNSTGGCHKALKYAEQIINSLGEKCLYADAGKTDGVCTACGACQNSGGCISEEIRALSLLCREADGFIFATPTHYASAAGGAVSVISRLLYSAKESLYGKPAFVIATARRAGNACAISEINTMLSFASMPIVSGEYPCIVYTASGANADKEGLQNIRTQTKNLLWLLRCINLGKEHGIEIPAKEKKIKTDLDNI